MIISLPFAGLRFAALTRWTQKLANRPRAWSGGYLLGKLLLKRINHLKERELIEIGIPGANPSHDPRVGCHSQKLVDNRPGGVPGVRSPPSALKPLAARGMKLRVGIGNIYQYIGVDDEH